MCIWMQTHDQSSWTFKNEDHYIWAPNTYKIFKNIVYYDIDNTMQIFREIPFFIIYGTRWDRVRFWEQLINSCFTWKQHVQIKSAPDVIYALGKAMHSNPSLRNTFPTMPEQCICLWQSLVVLKLTSAERSSGIVSFRNIPKRTSRIRPNWWRLSWNLKKLFDTETNIDVYFCFQ